MRITAVLTRVGPGLHFKEPAAVSVPLAHTASLGEDGPAPSPSSSSSPTVCVLTPKQSSATATSYLPGLGLLQTRASMQGPVAAWMQLRVQLWVITLSASPSAPLNRRPQGRLACVSITAPAQGRPSAQGRGFSGQEQRDGQSPGGSLLRDPFS